MNANGLEKGRKRGYELRKRGVKFGRKKHEIDATFRAVYPEWKQNKITAVEAMKRLGIKSNTFYRRVKEYEASELNG